MTIQFYTDFSDIVKVNGIVIAYWCFDSGFPHKENVFNKSHLHQSSFWESMLKAGYAINTQTSTLPAKSNEWDNRTWHLSIRALMPKHLST